MRLVFMGTPDFSVPVLQALLREDVVTAVAEGRFHVHTMETVAVHVGGQA